MLHDPCILDAAGGPLGTALIFTSRCQDHRSQGRS